MIMNRKKRSTRDGFALPVVILAMFLLVGALASGFTMISGERAADDAVIQQSAAQALAESGLQQAFTNRAGLGLGSLPAGSDSARLTVAGGYVDVITTRLRPAVGTTVPGIYYIRSRGVRTSSGVSGAGNAVAFATGFATFSTINLTVQSSLTSANGISKSGNSGEISGVDNCPAGEGGGKATLPAVAVPTVPGYSGHQGPLIGNPAVKSIGATDVAAAAAIPIDWNAIVNGGAVTADFYVEANGSGWPSQAYFDADTTRFPTIIVRNGPDPETMFVVEGFGRGTLIVFGSVWFKGNTGGWDGILMAGGRLKSSGGNQVRGATITGLNVKLGYNVGVNDVDELAGTKKFLYNSCMVAKALQNFSSGGLRAYQNSWANSFPAY
jgi:hypothetical protein